MIDIVLEMHWSNNPIPLDQLKSDPDCILDIPLGLFTSLESPVTSVQGKTGAVELDAEDVGADPVGAAQVVLETLDNQKLDKIDYVQHFRGLFSSYAALTAALPIALDGDYAHIDSGSGFDRMSAIWDSDDSKWTVNAVNVGSNTDEVPEGSTNLYFKSERVRQTSLTGLNTNDDSPVTQSDSIETAVGKLQAQNNNLSEPEWIDVSTLSGFTKNQNVSSSSKIEVAKINGMLWIRGYINTTAAINTNTTLIGFNDPNYILDYSLWATVGSDYTYDKLLAKTLAIDTFERKLLLKQVHAQGSPTHVFRIVADGSYSSFAEVYSTIVPTCIGKTLN
ncbi:MAG: hypothetical protein O2928_09305 [Proteobacteria bacterium]|nr:hypothetical protein [Pseudomonadota bacterium]